MTPSPSAPGLGPAVCSQGASHHLTARAVLLTPFAGLHRRSAACRHSRPGCPSCLWCISCNMSPWPKFTRRHPTVHRSVPGPTPLAPPLPMLRLMQVCPRQPRPALTQGWREAAMPGMLAAALRPLLCAVRPAHPPLLRGSCRGSRWWRVPPHLAQWVQLLAQRPSGGCS